MTTRTHEAIGFETSDRGFVLDPYPIFAALRTQGRPLWHESMGLWLAFRHADADDVLRDRRLGRIFHDRLPTELWETFNWLHSDSILDCEPPKHTRLKALVATAFGRGHIERLRPRIHELAVDLLARVDPRAFDLIADYAEPLPVMVIAELLGIPKSDQHHLRPWSQAIVKMYEYDRSAADEEAAREASAEFAAYIADLASHRRTTPGDDLVSHLAIVEDGGQRLSSQELIATCVLLLNAGHEASVNGFGNGLAALLRAPDELAKLRTDLWGQSAAAVEECLRYDSPLQLFARTATTDTEIGGVPIAAGEQIAALLGSANRDEAVFVEPDRLDLSREPNPQLGFGAGIHFCLGAPLARLELQTSLPVLLERYPSIELSAEPVLRNGFVLRGYEAIHVTTRKA